MGDHFALLVNRLLTESTLRDAIENRNRSEDVVITLEETQQVDFTPAEKLLADDDHQSAKKLAECRICQDEDFDSNMEMPCSCRGSLKVCLSMDKMANCAFYHDIDIDISVQYAHRRCVQRWCDEKGDTSCEICYQQFRPDYTARPPLLQYRHVPSNIRRNWEIRGGALNEPPSIRIAPADQTTDSDTDESPSRSLRCLAVAIIFLVLLILRHTLPIIIYGPDCCFPLIILVVLRIIGCALLLYIILLGMVGLQQYSSGFSDGSIPSYQEQREQPEQHERFYVVQVQ